MSDPETPVQAEPTRWMLLIHQLPPKPGYPRVKVWRRLQALGAVAVRNAAYVLPAGEQSREDFEWLLKEIGELGGEGMIWEARLVDGLSDDDVRGLDGGRYLPRHRVALVEEDGVAMVSRASEPRERSS